MAKFSKENQPAVKGRKPGPTFKNMLMDTLKEKGLLHLTEQSTMAEAEKAFLNHVAHRAFDPDDSSGSILLKELLTKTYPGLRSTLPTIRFDFDEKATPARQAEQVLKASADGLIPPDVAQIFISSIASMLKIDELTELTARLAELEKVLGVLNV